MNITDSTYQLMIKDKHQYAYLDCKERV
jgi:hypothetical protein